MKQESDRLIRNGNPFGKEDIAEVTRSPAEGRAGAQLRPCNTQFEGSFAVSTGNRAAGVISPKNVFGINDKIKDFMRLITGTTEFETTEATAISWENSMGCMWDISFW